ncbi:hypothetical protein ACTS9E_15280 [Empedobacter brevis]
MKHHVVRLTLRKTDSTVLLVFDTNSRKLVGFHTPNKVFDKQELLEMMDEIFPPNMDSIGDYSVKMAKRVDYLLLTKLNNQEEINQIQTTLNI